MAREIDATQALIEELVRAVSEETGAKPSIAAIFVAPMVRHLQTQYGGREVYIPQPGRVYEVDSMRAMLEKTGYVVATCKHFRVSRRTLYRLLEQAETNVA